MTTIAVDGLNEEEFRRSIENRLRWGKADTAVERLRSLLAPYAGPGRFLPERFLTAAAADLALNGWEALGDVVATHDRPGHPVTALSIAFGWPGEDVPAPDAAGRLAPHIETSYFTDEAFPFSQSAREDLLEGYSYHGCTWAGDCQATDTALSLEGIDDLHGALAALEARLLASEAPDEEGIRAGSLGACLLSVLLFQAVSERIARGGLPRPLCVMAGSNGVYPYFDAPVAGIPEEARKAAEAEAEQVEIIHGIPAPRYSSLLLTGIPRARKRAVLVLEESEDELAARLAKLRGLNHAAGEAHEDRDEALGEPPAAAVPDEAIAPAQSSPLLAKKPSGQSWDFREMLGPREPEPSANEPPPRELEDLPSPRLPAALGEPPAGPGFTLLEPDVQERLRSLITAYVPQPAEAPEPAPSASELQLELCWPYGPGWIEDDDAPTRPEAGPAEPAAKPARPGAWARLRAWWRGDAN